MTNYKIKYHNVQDVINAFLLVPSISVQDLDRTV